MRTCIHRFFTCCRILQGQLTLHGLVAPDMQRHRLPATLRALTLASDGVWCGFAAENLRQVQEKLAEQRVQLVEPPLSPNAPPRGPPLSMGRAHSANTELAELSIVHVTKAKQ